MFPLGPLPQFFVFAIGAILTGIALGFYLVAGLVLRRWPPWGLVLPIVFGVVVPVAVLAFDGAHRDEAFADLARRSRGLVEAIERFEAERGRPPASLRSLVPEYLPEIPGTGLWAHPSYEYQILPEERDTAGSAWELWVECSTGWGNYDSFRYSPSVDYRNRGFEAWPIGDWTYVHDRW